MTDTERLAAMRKLGVRWRKGHAIPTYPASMTQLAKDAADELYDAMSEDFIDRQGKVRA
jgi:hypothetical protein